MSTPTQRALLPAGELTYWQTLEKGVLHLGYRKRKADVPGLWWVRRYTGNRKSPYDRQTIGSADDHEPADGQRILSHFEATQRAIAKGTAKPAEKTAKGPLLVADVMADYLAFMRAERKSAGDAERRINALVLPTLGKLRVEDLTTDRLTRWRDSMVAEPARLRSAPGGAQRHKAPPATADAKRARRSTVNRTLTVLKAALNRAFEHGRCHDDLAWRRLKPYKAVDAARPGFLSPAEAVRLVNAADAASGFRNVVRAALATGCRYGELCNLLVRDLERGRIVIRTSKSGKARDVRLTPDAVAFFTQLCAGRPAGEHMLLRSDGLPWGPSHQARPMREACKRASISPAIGVHALRHSWASQAVMGGMPLLLVAENLGHSDTRMVEKHYGHLTDDYRDEMFAKHAPRLGTVETTNVVPMKEKA